MMFNTGARIAFWPRHEDLGHALGKLPLHGQAILGSFRIH